MKVLKAWRRTMLSILASMAFLPVAFSTSWASAQEGPMPPQIERGADGLGYYAPGQEPDPQQAYAQGYYEGEEGLTPGEAFAEDLGTEARAVGDRFHNFLALLAPYGEGGTCAPRWYDVSVEAFFFDRGVDRGTNIMAFGLTGAGGPALGTNNLNFDNEAVMRFTAAGQVGPAGLVEFSYMGLGNWSSNRSASSGINDLYSRFSDFGVSPAFGYAETDQASFASLAYSSTFDSYEINLRRRWQSPTCLFQGSYLAGVRHFRLEETALLHIDGIGGSSDYRIDTANALTGFQLGGDMYLSAIPGILVGGEAKAGIYGNNADQATTRSNLIAGIPNSASEALGKDTASFVGEAGVNVLYRISQNITLKGGYHCLYVSSVALASENFNFDVGGGFLNPRTPRINNGGSVFYHGGMGGVEFAW